MSPWIAFGLGCVVGAVVMGLAVALWVAGIAVAVDAAGEGQ